MTLPSNNHDDRLVEERRKFIRLDVSAKVRFSIITRGNLLYDTTSKNIAAGGLCFATDKPLKKEDVLLLEILLPQDPPAIIAKGKVSWIRPSLTATQENAPHHDVGVAFIDIDPPAQEKINRYVHSVKFR